MTNLEFFSKIYGSEAVEILHNHDMKVVSATETTATIEYRRSWASSPLQLYFKCDDAVSMADAFDREAKNFAKAEDRFAEYVETCKAVAAEIREALGKHTPINEQGEMTLQRAEELLKDILTNAVMSETYNDKGIEISPSSYDDTIGEDTIMDAYSKYCDFGHSDGYDTFRAYLEMYLYEHFFDETVADEESELFDKVCAEVKETIDGNDKLTEAWNVLKEAYIPAEILELGGLTDGVYIDFNAFLDNDTYKINLMFAGKNEQNLDMGSIYELFKSEDKFKDLKSFEEYQDNALSYLIRQQGYTTADVLLAKESKTDNKFIQSVVDELDNTTYSMNELTFLTSCGGVQLVELLDKIAKGEGYIELHKQTETGLFNEWSGCGSILEIVLEKPAVFPVAMIRNLQLEGAKSNDGYTVDNVYGLTGGTWNKSTVELTDTPPVLREEDLKATYKLLSDTSPSKTTADAEYENNL